MKNWSFDKTDRWSTNNWTFWLKVSYTGSNLTFFMLCQQFVPLIELWAVNDFSLRNVRLTYVDLPEQSPKRDQREWVHAPVNAEEFLGQFVNLLKIPQTKGDLLAIMLNLDIEPASKIVEVIENVPHSVVHTFVFNFNHFLFILL